MCPFLVSPSFVPSSDSAGARGGTGSVRRPQRAPVATALAPRAAHAADAPGHAPAPRRPTGDRPRPGAGSGYEVKRTAKFRRNPPPKSPARGTSASTTMTACQSSRSRGLTGCLPCPGRRSESRGASWNRLTTQHQSSRFSTLLCRRQWTQWWESFISSSSVGRWVLSRFWTVRLSGLLTCPRSCCKLLLSAALSLSRRWPNSWWQCL